MKYPERYPIVCRSACALIIQGISSAAVVPDVHTDPRSTEVCLYMLNIRFDDRVDPRPEAGGAGVWVRGFRSCIYGV